MIARSRNGSVRMFGFFRLAGIVIMIGLGLLVGHITWKLQHRERKKHESESETFNRKEVLQYLRWTGSEIPPEVDALIDDCMAETLRVSEPRFIYRILPIDWEAHTPELAFVGQDIPNMLADSDRVVLLAATLGGGLELAIRRAQVRDMSRAVVLDCCGSAAIEAVCDAAEREIQSAVGEGVYLTDRFSPGYGDLPILLQDDSSGWWTRRAASD